jgi:geranylgeranyl diphosphate synthase, type I
LFVRLLSSEQQARIESHLEQLLPRLLDAEHLGAFRDAMIGYVMAGGKRIRPQLTIWTYLNSTPSPSKHLPDALLDLACGWELFHAFLLVHDDIIDGAEQRRDKPALHVSLAALDSNSPIFGRNLGIVAGDLMFSACMRLWHELDVELRCYRDLLKLFSRVACTTGFGQAIDIVQSHLPMDLVDEQTLLREYHWKTAAYTFEGPMLSGAILAGLGKDAQDAISKYSLALGQAYQLQNDLIDLGMPAHEGSDIVQGKRTVTMLRHRASLTDNDRAALDRNLDAIARGNGHAVDMAESLRIKLLDVGVTHGTENLIGQLLTDAQNACTDPALPRTLSGGMSGLLAALVQQYFKPVAVAQ